MPSGSGAHDAGDPHHVLAAHVDVVVDDALHDAGVVAQVDEREVLAVLAAAGDPAAQGDGLADVLGAELTVLVAAHRRGAHGEDLLDGLEEIGSGHDVLVVLLACARSGRTTDGARPRARRCRR